MIPGVPAQSALIVHVVAGFYVCFFYAHRIVFQNIIISYQMSSIIIVLSKRFYLNNK